MAQNTHSLDLEASSNQYLYILDANQTGLDNNTDMSFACWARFESLGTNAFMSKWHNIAGQNTFLFWYQNSDTSLNLSVSDGTNTGEGGRPSVTWAPSIDTWYHVACTFKGSTGATNFYVNGSQVGTEQTSTQSSMINSTGQFEIGRRADSIFYFDGLIDEAVVTSDVLTANEIVRLYQHFTPTTAGIDNVKGYWTLNDTKVDSSGNGNDLSDSASVPSFTTTVPFVYYAPQGGNPMFFSGGVTIG